MIGQTFLPEHWFSRMETIQTYEQDKSAMSRINAWGLALNVASARITGGGFKFWDANTFTAYDAPYPQIGWQGPHSIYFEVIGEHGYIGLFLFLGLITFIWRSCSLLQRDARRLQGLEWIERLSAAVKTSLVAYMTGGAFLELAMFDLPYSLMAIVIVTQRYLVNETNNRAAAT